jgi:hypothetical protein
VSIENKASTQRKKLGHAEEKKESKFKEMISRKSRKEPGKTKPMQVSSGKSQVFSVCALRSRAEGARDKGFILFWF